MEIEEIIQSGILELYVLDEISSFERREIENLRLVHPIINHEILQIELALETLMSNSSVEIPQDNLCKIKERLNIKTPIESPYKHFQKILTIAASILICVLTFTTFYYSNKYIHTDRELNAMRKDQTIFADLMHRVEFELTENKKELALVYDTSFSKIILKGLPIAINHSALVYWNPQEGHVFLNLKNMPKTNADKQYRLWAIVEGKPKDLGPVNPQSNLIQANSVLNPQAFAITLEPLGGNENPTMEQMYAYAPTTK